MLKARKANRVLKIPDEKKKTYIALGYTITDMDGNMIHEHVEPSEKLEQAEQRKIRVVMLNDEGGISILVENPVVGKVDINELRTTKADKENHGLGLKNIKSIVQKYEGNFQIEIENQIFRVKIYLPN